MKYVIMSMLSIRAAVPVRYPCTSLAERAARDRSPAGTVYNELRQLTPDEARASAV
jgi:hypothetical protein